MRSGKFPDEAIPDGAVSDDETFAVEQDVVQFSMLPNWLLETDPVLSANAIKIYFALATYGSGRGGGNIVPSLPTIGDKAGLSVPVVKRAIKELESVGAVVSKQRVAGDGGYTSKIYRLAFNKPFDVSPVRRGGSYANPPQGSESIPPQGINRIPPPGITGEPLTRPTINQTQGTREETTSPLMSEAAALAVRRGDVERICVHLADRIEGNGSKRPTITKGWRDAARLMLDRDNRTEDEVHGAIDWCQNDEFWRGNILSVPKLRSKYDQLRLQAQRQQQRPMSRAQADGDMFDRAMERAIAREANQ